MIGVSVPQLDIPSKTNGTAKYGIDAMLPGMVYGAHRDAAGALWRDGEIGRRQRGQERAGLHQGGHPRRQDRHHDRLGGRGRQHLCQCPQGGGRAEGHLRQRPECQRVEPVAARRGQAAAGARRFRPVLRQGRRPGGGLRHRGEGDRGGIHHQHQHPCADGADERHCGVQGRHPGTSIPATSSRRVPARSRRAPPASIRNMS